MSDSFKKLLILTKKVLNNASCVNRKVLTLERPKILFQNVHTRARTGSDTKTV